MKKILAIALSVAMLLSLGVVFASAAPGFYCGGSEENFAPVGDIQITWDTEASSKLNLNDGDMQDWADSGYNLVSIGPNNMISWVGGSAENQAGGVPENWGFQAFFVGDPEYLYIGFYVTDPDVILVQDANGYNDTNVGGDAFQFMVDFDGALGKAMEADPDLFGSGAASQSGQCVFYSFGCMGETATPIQMKVECNDDPGIMSEANGDHVKGSTFKTETGWCAEFAIGWDELYGDFAYKAYADNYECSVTEGDPLEVSCALYYQNHDTGADGARSTGINWAAGTLKSAEAGKQPEINWDPKDCGIRLYVEYSEDLEFQCEGIKVYKVGETPAPVTDAPEEPKTDAPETDAPATDAPTTDAPATDAPQAGTKAPETTAQKSGCSGVIGTVAVILTAAAAAVVLKKKD